MTEAKTRTRTTRRKKTSTTRKRPAARAGTRKRNGTPKAKTSTISPEQRHRMIQEAAYYRAEREQFQCDPWYCWLEAEAEVDGQLQT